MPRRPRITPRHRIDEVERLDRGLDRIELLEKLTAGYAADLGTLERCDLITMADLLACLNRLDAAAGGAR